MNIKHEALFCSLAGFSKELIDQDDKYSSKMMDIAIVINRYFSKSKKRYNKLQVGKIAMFLKDTIEPQLASKVSPLLMLTITLDYLLNEIRHLETRIAFYHLKSDINHFTSFIELNEKYSKVYFEHCKLLSNIMKG